MGNRPSKGGSKATISSTLVDLKELNLELERLAIKKQKKVAKRNEALRNQGQPKEVEELYKLALEEHEISILNIVDKLSILYYDQGRFEEAEDMCQRALEGYKTAPGPDHEWTLHTLQNLGLIYKKQGQLTNSEEMFELALKGYEKALGSNHTWTLQTFNNLGVVYMDQGKLKNAEKMFQCAIKGYDKALEPDLTLTVATTNLGILYVNQGKLKEAEEMYQRALKLGPDHIDRLHEMFQCALDGMEEALGPDHASTLDIARNLVALCGELNEVDPVLLRFQIFYYLRDMH